MEEAKRTQRQIHMYKHTCWVGSRLTSAEQRAGPPITEHRACGLAPLVRVSAAPCPPSQKQGNGLCYSLLLTLQQTWGWVPPPPHHTRTHTHTPPSPCCLFPPLPPPFPSLQVVFHSFYSFPWCVSNILPPKKPPPAITVQKCTCCTLPGSSWRSRLLSTRRDNSSRLGMIRCWVVRGGPF